MGGTQELLRIERSQKPGTLPLVENLLPVRFVPMTGQVLASS
jgi:protein-L-isoaspartate(D-aspartate) O-methyltransferase